MQMRMKREIKTERQMLQQCLQEFIREFKPKLKGPAVVCISDVGTSAPEGVYDSLDPNESCISVMVLKKDMPLKNKTRFPGEYSGLPVVLLVI